MGVGAGRSFKNIGCFVGTVAAAGTTPFEICAARSAAASSAMRALSASALLNAEANPAMPARCADILFAFTFRTLSAYSPIVCLHSIIGSGLAPRPALCHRSVWVAVYVRTERGCVRNDPVSRRFVNLAAVHKLGEPGKRCLAALRRHYNLTIAGLPVRNQVDLVPGIVK
jgi:hypothetical protein